MIINERTVDDIIEKNVQKSLKREPIAIIGIGCRLPGEANSPDEFWELLKNGVDAVKQIPPDRWNVDALYHPDFNRKGKINTREGGFISQIDLFDAGFFEIPPIEAMRMDPQQRILLEVVFQAIEDAGLKLEDLSNTKTGVLVGISTHDYGDLSLLPSEHALILGSTIQGNSLSIAANRISYIFNMKGPSLAIDTACSSSINALHVACRSIWGGDATKCVVAGANLLLRPESQMTFSKGGFLSPDSRCQAFDARANGYIRGEGAGAIILKPLRQALLDNDDIYGTIVGTAINQDGRTTGLPMPNLDSQIDMLKAAYADAGVDPKEVSYIEAHGTGTAIGDFTEGTSIGTVNGKGRKPGQKLLIGSVKTNIGHLESGSGIAGLIKLALVLKNRQVPPNNHFITPNPKIPFDEYNLQVPTHMMDLPKNGEPLYAGINSFGFGGANAHAVLQAAPIMPPREKILGSQTRKAQLLVLSAKSAKALQDLTDKYVTYLSQTKEDIIDICYSAGARRSAMDHRLAVSGYTKEELIEKLEAFKKGTNLKGMANGRPGLSGQAKVAFVYSGQGPQWFAMGRQLLKEDPIFRQTMEKIQEILAQLGWLKEEGSSLIQELEKDEKSSRINETCIAQPAIFAIQVAVTEVWKSLGVVPSAIVGHSIGEVAASYVSGALSLEEASRVVYWRSRCQMRAEGKGTMLAVGLSEEKAKARIKGYEDKVAIAVINGPALLTLAGDTSALDELAKQFSAEDIFNRPVKVSVPFHSPYMDPIKEEFLNSLGRLDSKIESVPLYSTVTGGQIKGPELTAAYWYKNIREPVLFYPTIKKMVGEDFNTFVEIGPHPILSKSIDDTLSEVKKKGIVVASLRRQEDEQIAIIGSVGQLFVNGYTVDWNKMFNGPQKFVKLPFYAWQKDSYWLESEGAKQARIGKPIHPHLKEVKTSPKEKDAFIWDISLDKRLEPYIDDHKVQGPIIYPGAGHVELSLSAGLASFKEKFGFLEDFHFKNALFLPDDGEPPQIQLEIQGNEGNFFIATRPRYSEVPWTIHSYGRMNHMGDAFVSEKVDLKQLKKQIPNEVNVSTLYEGLLGSGLHLGATFQAIKRLWNSEREALGELHVHDELKVGFEGFNIHPAILDASFQTLFGVMHKRPDGVWDNGVYIPVVIDRVKFYQKPATHKIWSYVRLVDYSPKLAKGNVWILDDNENLVAEIQGLTCQYLDGSRGEKAGELDNCFYEYVYKRKTRIEEEINRTPEQYLASPVSIEREMQEFIKNVIVANPLHSKFLDDFDSKLHKMSLTYMVHGLREMGINLGRGQTFKAEDLISKYGVVERHHRLFNFILTVLQNNGYLKAVHSGWEVIIEPCTTIPQEMMSQLLDKYPEFLHELTLLQRCASRLKDVLQGKQDPVQLIFPENDWDAVVTYYMQAHSFKMYNDMAQHAIPLLLKNLPEEQTLRVIEVGAGTGGITQAILPVLPADRTEYYYTDLSHMFMLKAQKRFSKYPFVQYSLLDLEKEPNVQGYLPNSFDIVVASDVVHATRDAKETLRQIQKLLAPNGLLVMLEVTKCPVYNDLVFGMTEGWWMFEDTDIRPQHPTMPIKQWMSVLESVGFHSILPVTDVPANDKSSQTIFFARNAMEIKQENKVAAPAIEQKKSVAGRWVLFQDKNGLAEAMQTRLEKDGKSCYMVNPGKSYNQTTKKSYEINPESKEDMHQLLTSILEADTTPIQGVIHLWSLYGVANDKISSKVLDESQALMCQSAVNLAHELNDLKNKPSLWLVTTGSEIIGEEIVEPMLSQSPMRGLGRVIINELPGLKTSLVDLSAQPQAEEIDNFYKEFWSEKKEDEISLRGKKRFLNIFSRILPERAQTLAQKKVPGIGQPYHAEITEYGVMDNLVLREKERKAPGADEVEIEIHASALNFRDIMIAMGFLSDEAIEGGIFGRNFGLECAGKIAAVGKNVKDFKVGDEVIALASDCIGSYTTTFAKLVVPKPEHLSFKEAATIPLVYMTAHYALNYLCRMRQGEKVLIHAATGGVGLAAINLAKQVGAEIYATAGNEEKRAYLRKLGIKHIYDTRTLAFKDGIMKDTDGKGVDIILNSLSGKAIHQNFGCLAPYGRFVEIGKADIYNNTRIGLKPFGQNLAYFAVDVDRLCMQRTELAGELFKELMEFFNQKTFAPHPFHEYPISKVADAFRLLSQSKQIGKVVLDMTEKEVIVAPASQLNFRKDSSYLIIGGCGGFGLAVAKWMAEKGAGQLVLMARSGVKNPEDQKIVDEMLKKGIKVNVVKGDVSNMSDVEKTVDDIQKSGLPLRGVIHSALVLEDAPLREMTLERFMKAVRPKMTGAWNLHLATLNMPLDHFVMFSSIASSYGGPGQCNYAAGNAFMDKLVSYRRSKGLVANTISWGTLAEVGFVARSGKVQDILNNQGWRAFRLHDSLALLEKMMLQNIVHRTAADVVWEDIAKFFEHNVNSTRFSHLFKEKGSSQLSEGGGSLFETLNKAKVEERFDILLSQLRDSVARVLGTASNKLDIETSLTKLGLDSLMANQIRNWVQNNVGVDYSLMKVMKGPTVSEMAKELIGELKFDSAEAAATNGEKAQAGTTHAHVLSEVEINRWIIKTNPQPDARMRLFCFTYMGAGASVYHSWGAGLPKEIEVCTIQLPGREDRSKETPIENLHTLDEILSQLILRFTDKPFAFYGHSFGARAAFRLAGMLEKNHNIKPTHVFVGASLPPQIYNPLNKIFEGYKFEKAADVPENLIVTLLKELGVKENVYNNAEIMNGMLPALRADIRLMQMDNIRDLISITTHLIAVASEKDKLYTIENQAEWIKYAGNGFALETVPGGHLFIHEDESKQVLFKLIPDIMLNKHV